MFLPIDIPFVEKKVIHRRSKTNYVLCYQNSNSQVSNKSHEFQDQTKNSKSTHRCKSILLQKHIEKENQTYLSVKEMTEKIEHLINKELQSPQFVSSIHQKLSQRSKHLSPEMNPENKNKFSKPQVLDRKVENGFLSSSRQVKYETLIKQSEKINSKSFVPHFNWKEKLIRLKNMGNYDQIYKKKSEKVIQRKIMCEKSEQKNETVNEAKLMLKISNKYNLNEKEVVKKYINSGQRFNTTNEEFLSLKQISLKRQNMTCIVENKLYSENLRSLTKNSQLEKDHHNGRVNGLSEREWKFEPWDDLE